MDGDRKQLYHKHHSNLDMIIRSKQDHFCINQVYHGLKGCILVCIEIIKPKIKIASDLIDSNNITPKTSLINFPPYLQRMETGHSYNIKTIPLNT